jgi:uncharacterized protein RhaS with RHS repeats
MKALNKYFVLIAAALFIATQAQAVLTWARPYDPNLGRWIQRDPIGEQGGLNLYRYVANDPLNFYDPYGLTAYPPGFVGPIRPGDYITKTPPSNIPGGPFKFYRDSQNSRGGTFYGPKQPDGTRAQCTYSPPGAIRGNNPDYFKSGGNYYSADDPNYATPITQQQAKSPVAPPAQIPIRIVNPTTGETVTENAEDMMDGKMESNFSEDSFDEIP